MIYLLTGLGNPGREYRDSRHNVGFMVIDQICKQLGIRPGRLQSKALIASKEFEGHKLYLAKPQTYMNLSGQSVSALVRFYKIPLEQTIVIHDDLDLPFGVLRIRSSGGSAGQRGLGSIIERLATQEFPRLRVGIGRPPGNREAADYVLESFSSAERAELPIVLEHAAKAALDWVQFGIEPAMNKYNGPIVKD